MHRAGGVDVGVEPFTAQGGPLLLRHPSSVWIVVLGSWFLFLCSYHPSQYGLFLYIFRCGSAVLLLVLRVSCTIYVIATFLCPWKRVGAVSFYSSIFPSVFSQGLYLKKISQYRSPKWILQQHVYTFYYLKIFSLLKISS